MDSTQLNDDIILEYIAPNGNLITQRCLKNVLEKRGYMEYLESRYSNNTLQTTDKEHIREILYRLVKGIEQPPHCKICGKPIIFKNNSYALYCSHSCSNKDESVKSKISSSCSKSLKKAYADRGDEIKEKRSKTLSLKYGEDVIGGSPFELREIQKSATKKVEERYGVDNVFKLESTREKIKQSIRDKSIKTQMDRGIDVEYLDGRRYLVKNCCPIHGDLVFDSSDFHNRFRLDRYKVSNPCYICNPFGSKVSGQQSSLLNYIKSIYSGTIIENDHTVLDGLEIDIYLPELKLGFEFNGDYWHMNPLMHRYDDINPTSHMSAIDKWKGDRHKILKASEKGVNLIHIWEYHFMKSKDQVLDFVKNIICGEMEYLHPLIKLKNTLDETGREYSNINDMIFDFDGLRVVYMDGLFSGNKTIDKDYLDSLKSPDKRTMFVYDYEITDDRKFSIISSDIRFGLGIIDKRIYARKCDVKILRNSDVKDFLEENSLFGYRSSSYIIGLFNEGELVMVYTFGNNFYGRSGATEVIRVCSKKGYQIIGGCNKCLNHYLKNVAKEGERIIFYVDAIHHDGSSMMVGDFEFVRHEYGTMNYYVEFGMLGHAENRSPSKHKEYKGKIEDGSVIQILTNGVDVYQLKL